MGKINSLFFHSNNAPAARNFLCVDSSVWARDVLHVADFDVFVLNFLWSALGVLVNFCSIRFDNVDFLHFFQRNAFVLANPMRLLCDRLSVSRGKIVSRWTLRGWFWDGFLSMHVKLVSGIDAVALVSDGNQHLHELVVIFNNFGRRLRNLVFFSAKLREFVVRLHNVCGVIFVHEGGTLAVRSVLGNCLLWRIVILGCLHRPNVFVGLLSDLVCVWAITFLNGS